MSTELANKQSGAVAALAGLKKGLSHVRRSLPQSSLEPILKLGRDGYWSYGQDNVDVEENSRWAVNILSIMHGFVCWTNYDKSEKKKNELLGEVYAPMADAPILVKELPDHDWPWKPATTVLLKCVSDGDDEGTQVIYKPSSTGGANAMDALLAAVEKQIDSGSSDVIPIVELDYDTYDHKTYGKTYVPIFNIKSWVGLDATSIDEPVDDGEPETEPEQAPEVEEKVDETSAPKKTRTRKTKVEEKTEPEKEAEPKKEKPATEGRTRRRRRS